uniref:Uncharacterized protein n=1 Tax=Trichobilharzia regenti TaxID=157069 RepID=A0AA85KD54_TRIRE|nr:unnamed protein product [Trichobilharzia regenti]
MKSIIQLTVGKTSVTWKYNVTGFVPYLLVKLALNHLSSDSITIFLISARNSPGSNFTDALIQKINLFS